MLAEAFGWIGTALLVVSMCQNKLRWLRLFNIIATLFYLTQAIMLGSVSLVFTDLMLIFINMYKIRGGE